MNNHQFNKTLRIPHSLSLRPAASSGGATTTIIYEEEGSKNINTKIPKSRISVEFINPKLAKITHSLYIDDTTASTTTTATRNLSTLPLLPPNTNPQCEISQSNPSPFEHVIIPIASDSEDDENNGTKLGLRINFGKDFTLNWFSTTSLTKDGKEVKMKNDDDQVQQQHLFSDLPWRAYEYSSSSSSNSMASFHHYMKDEGQSIYGLGEKTSGPTGRDCQEGEEDGIRLNGRRFSIATADAMGYDAAETDPLYKHIPLLISVTTPPSSSSKNHLSQAYAIFYNTTLPSEVNLSKEIDALWGSYHSFKSLSPSTSLEFYILLGPTIPDLMKGLSNLLGKPALMPKFAYGYLASSMGYAERGDAQVVVEQFPEKLKKHQIPCDVLHLSSGYTVSPITNQRNIFTWNPLRFPDPPGFLSRLKNAGIRVVANVKPWMMTAHPAYAEANGKKIFVMNGGEGGGGPSLCRLWSAGPGESGEGSYIDFVGKEGRTYWKAGIKHLLSLGITGIWNDNNEFNSISSDSWRVGDWMVNKEGKVAKEVQVGECGAALFTLLMATASYEAMEEVRPDIRPYLITRSSTTGTHRYSSTWSGDNFTSWHTLKHNIPMGLHAGLSLLSNYGHDIGGFAGPLPSPELFLRWIQCGIYLPRFCIHSWKEGGITEPWMYPEILLSVREAIILRYKLLPYIYSLAIDSHLWGSPIIRSTFYHFQGDPRSHKQAYEFLLGEWMLICPVYEKGTEERNMYLPQNQGDSEDYMDFFSGEWYKGGQKVIVKAPLFSQAGVVMIRSGAVIPFNPEPGHNSDQDFKRDLLLFPGTSGCGPSLKRKAIVISDDDGISSKLKFFQISVEMTWNEKEVLVNLKVLTGEWKPAYRELRMVLPVKDKRTIILNGNPDHVFVL